MKNPLSLKPLSGIFTISMGALFFELLVSRVMSVVAWYHFAFLAICLALFGMATGAMLVHRRQAEWSRDLPRSLSRASLFFSGSVLVHFLIVCTCPAFTQTPGVESSPDYHPVNLLLIFVSVALPLTAAGVILALVFSAFSLQANRIYCADLSGAAIGCLLFIPVIQILGVANAYLALALLGLLSAALLGPSPVLRRWKTLLPPALLLAGLMAGNGDGQRLPLRWAKGRRDNTAFFKKWNAFSYVRLMDWGPNHSPVGWGFAPRKRDEILRTRVPQIYLDIDAMAGTVMTGFSDHNPDRIRFLQYDITALPYRLVSNGDALVIGIGAGRDILTAWLSGQRSITGVEFNDTILDLHRTRLAKFSGDLGRLPNVQFIHAEARSFLRASKQTYDLIQLSLIDTFAATQAGAYALTENNLYTVEALQEYLRHLSDRGVIGISYWMQPGHPEAMLKLTGTAAEALRREGLRRTRDFLVIAHKDGQTDGRGVATLLIRKTPFPDETLAALRAYCGEMGFSLILSPAGAAEAGFGEMADADTLDAYARRHATAIAPATDDRPFFFLTTRFDLREAFQSAGAAFGAEQILFPLLLLMTLLTGLLVIRPLWIGEAAARRNVAMLPFSMYFIAIGLAYMLIELPQLSRLSAFLGHPIYGLSIVLFSFLASSGLGSFVLGREDRRGRVAAGSAVFLLLCAAALRYTTPALDTASRFPLLARQGIAALLIFPMGFFMGAFIPQGMRLLGQRNGPVALFWGLNAAASVLGSILAMILQITVGIQRTFSLGAGLYVLAALLLWRLKFPVRSGGTEPHSSSGSVCKGRRTGA